MALQRRIWRCISSIAGKRRHVGPVAEDDAERGQRRAQLVRGAAGEQAHAHDMHLLGGALPQLGQLGVALAQVAVDADDEDGQQRHVQHEAQQQAAEVAG
jgi:hypothetical protein